MLIVAALRWSDQRAGVDPLTGEVHTSTAGSGPSEADRCALEHALRLAAALPGGRCVAVTVGPPEADALLRDALAAGTDAVLRIAAPEDGASRPVSSMNSTPVSSKHDRTTVMSSSWTDHDGHRTALLLCHGVVGQHGPPDVVVCGDRSTDRGTGSTPAFLAAFLGARQALGLLELSIVDGTAELTAVRRLDGGRRERLRIELPAVCSVEPTEVRLRRAPLPAVLASRAAPIPVVAGSAPPDRRVRVTAVRPYRPRPRALPATPTADPHRRMVALSGALVRHDPPRLVTPPNPRAAATELLEFLRQQGFAP